MPGKDEKLIVKAKGPSGPAKIHSDDPKHMLGLVQYLRTIGYTAWIEDTNGNEIEETVLKNAIKEMLHEQTSKCSHGKSQFRASYVRISPR
jgi:hypothetical protein